MSEDAELLSRYVRERSEAAFVGLVERHLPLVYSAALRQINGDLELAKVAGGNRLFSSHPSSPL